MTNLRASFTGPREALVEGYFRDEYVVAKLEEHDGEWESPLYPDNHEAAMACMRAFNDMLTECAFEGVG